MEWILFVLFTNSYYGSAEIEIKEFENKTYCLNIGSVVKKDLSKFINTGVFFRKATVKCVNANTGEEQEL